MNFHAFVILKNPENSSLTGLFAEIYFMPLRILFKLILLLISLTATLIAIYWLKQGHSSAFLTSLGFSSGQFNWCEERVKSLYLFDLKAKIQEVDGTWQWVKEDKKKTLDYLRIEKWFAKYCHISLDSDEEGAEVDSESSLAFSGKKGLGIRPSFRKVSKAVFEVEFINGNHLVLKQKKDYFKIGDRFFQSESFRKGLEELFALGSQDQE